MIAFAWAAAAATAIALIAARRVPPPTSTYLEFAAVAIPTLLAVVMTIKRTRDLRQMQNDREARLAARRTRLEREVEDSSNRER